MLPRVLVVQERGDGKFLKQLSNPAETAVLESILSSPLYSSYNGHHVRLCHDMSRQGHLPQCTLCQCTRHQTPLTIFVFSFQATWTLLIFWEVNYKGCLLVYRSARWLCASFHTTPSWKLSGPEAGWTDDTQVIMGALDTTSDSQYEWISEHRNEIKDCSSVLIISDSTLENRIKKSMLFRIFNDRRHFEGDVEINGSDWDILSQVLSHKA